MTVIYSMYTGPHAAFTSYHSGRADKLGKTPFTSASKTLEILGISDNCDTSGILVFKLCDYKSSSGSNPPCAKNCIDQDVTTITLSLQVSPKGGSDNCSYL